MRILGVFPAYEPAWAFGGVVRCTSNLFRALAALGAEVTVYTTNASGNGQALPVAAETPMDAGGVRVQYFPGTFGPNSTFDSRRLTGKLASHIGDFDIVYAAAIWQWMGISAAGLARRRGVPCVIGPHGALLSQAFSFKRLKKTLFWYGLLKPALRGAVVHFASEFERAASGRLTANHHSFIVPNPLSTGNGVLRQETPEADGRARFGIPADSFLLLTVTRAHPDKRLDIVLEALKSIVGSGLHVRLLVVGPFDNAYGARIKALARKLGVSAAVVWAGYQSGGSLEACYRASDLFVLPSAHENFCMVAAEAMAHGLPVVVSRHVGIAGDIERHRAGVVTDADVAQVTNAILMLIANPHGRREMARRAQEMALQLYGPERVARLMLRAFEDILSGSRSPECAWQ